MSLQQYLDAFSHRIPTPLPSQAAGPFSNRADDIIIKEDTTNLETIDVTQREEKYGDRPVITLTASVLQAKSEKDKYESYAMILRRRIDRDRMELGTNLEIRSSIIRNIVREVFGDYPYVNTLGCPILISKPYSELFHYRHELYGYPCKTDEETKHLEVLTAFMKDHLGETETMYSRMVPHGLISFHYLWTLFRPGEIVVHQQDDRKECLQIISTETKFKDEGVVFQLKALFWTFNGARFGSSVQKLKIPEFLGVRKIVELNVYPLNQLPAEERDSLKTALTIRGHKWRDLVSVSHREYDGVASLVFKRRKEASGSDTVGEEWEISPRYVSGRIVLDCKSFYQANPVCLQILEFAGTPIDSDQPLSSDEDFISREDRERAEKRRSGIRVSFLNRKSYVMSETQALLSPAEIVGFSLVEKAWAGFLVDKVESIKWAESAFQKLELDSSTKEIMQSLVERHQASRIDFDDVVAGKGKGLVFLLFGPPGCGKTLTAETIAEKTQKPLYWVTSGELGTEVTTTDSRLRAIFGLAKAWDAILLLDEADVFLAKRTSSDLVRNAFVSIFLRSIEYYQGILFLTSNRHKDFDDAFQSRIHLSLKYPPLDDVRRANIWRNLLTDKEPRNVLGPEGYERLGKKYELNGREIKNLIATARAISTQLKRPLDEMTIDLVFNLNQKA